jgi:hypothetical protein
MNRTNSMTIDEIKKQYGLTTMEVDKIKSKLLDMTERDILFSYPDGPWREIAEYQRETSR